MTSNNFLKSLIGDIFTISVVSLVVFFTAEIIKPGFITNYFNLNLFLLWCILIGIIQVLITKD